MHKKMIRSLCAMGLMLSMALSSNTFAADQAHLDRVIKNANDAFALLDSNVVTHQAAIRAEYMYLMVLYADLMSARMVGDVATAITESVGAPELVTKLAGQGTSMIVLWSPAAIATAFEVSKRFRHLGYALPQSLAFADETMGVLKAYRESVILTKGKITLDYERFLGGILKPGKNIAKIAGATVLNYSAIVGAFYLSKDAISFTAMSSADLRTAQREVENRLSEIRKELPEVQTFDWLMDANYRAINWLFN